jgi:hypothetical protein
VFNPSIWVASFSTSSAFWDVFWIIEHDQKTSAERKAMYLDSVYHDQQATYACLQSRHTSDASDILGNGKGRLKPIDGYRACLLEPFLLVLGQIL